MPIYTYECPVHKEFEEQQSIKDPPLEKCPQCVEAGIMEHRCDKCDIIIGFPTSEEEVFGGTGSDSMICFTCGKKLQLQWHKPKKLISLSSFVLKGGGWAAEGYK